MKNPPTEPHAEPNPNARPEVIPPAAATVDPNQAGLPTDELMTPEIAEEEAQRGDFVIRWGVILLAVLLGWTHITSTMTLTHIRIGQVLRANGVLPPRTDVLSSTMRDEPWTNASWLGDLVLGAIYDLGGDVALTVWNAILVGLCFWLISRISRPGASTWWGSLCGLATLLALFPLLTPGPTLVTVVGLSLLLTLLHRDSESPGGVVLWWSVPLMFLWSNMDERAYYGLVLLVLFALGRVLQKERCGCRKRLTGIVVAAIVAACLHPFPGSVFTSAINFQSVFLPAMQNFGGELSQEFPHLWLRTTNGAAWTATGPYIWGAAVVAGMALLAVLLSFRKLDLSWLLVAVGANVIGLLSGTDFTAMALVNCVVATLLGQSWYVANVRQEYTINPRELLFSRGGRAVTVLGMFVCAYLGISGWLTGADGRRIGVGFSSELQADIDSYRELLGSDVDKQFDDQLFHFTPRQGDLLVWSGRRSYIDSRFGLFGQSATPEKLVLPAHQSLANSLIFPSNLKDSTEFEAWVNKRRQQLQDSGTLQVIVPLRTQQDYALWSNLLEQLQPTDGRAERVWRQLVLSGGGARLIRLDGLNPAQQGYVLAQPTSSTIAKTFGVKQDGETVNRSMFPSTPTFYEQSLLLPVPQVSNEIRIGEHYSQRLHRAQFSRPEVAAYCYQAIRHARRGLFNDHNNRAGYRMLGSAYANLYFLEQELVDSPQTSQLVERRYFQAISALHHALIRDPNDLGVELLLLQLYINTHQNDLAMDTLERIKKLTGARDGDEGSYTVLAPNAPEYAASRQELKLMYEQLREHVYETLQLVQQSLADENQQIGPAVQLAISRGCPRLAVDVIDAARTQLSFPSTAADPTVVTRVYRLNLDYIRSLLLMGRTSDAWDIAESLRSDFQGSFDASAPASVQLHLSRMQYLTPLSGYANLAADRMDAAADAWSEYATQRIEFSLETAMASLPGISLPPELFDRASAFHLGAAVDLQFIAQGEWEQAEFQAAFCELEQGRNNSATKRLDRIILNNPDGPLRRHAAFYLSLLTGVQIPLDGPARTQAMQEAAAAEARRNSRPPSPALPQPAPIDPTSLPLPEAFD